MTIKRFILTLLTIFAVGKLLLDLVGSFSQPQVQSRLQLYQTNLILHASEYQVDNNRESAQENFDFARQALIGEKAYYSAQKQYEKSLEVAEKSRENLRRKLEQQQPTVINDSTVEVPPLAQPSGENKQNQQLVKAIAQVDRFIDELQLKIGIIQARQDRTEEAIATWNQIIESSPDNLADATNAQIAEIVKGLWSEIPVVIPGAEEKIQANLEGWFRYRALYKLYEIQGQSAKLAALESQEETVAQTAMVKLTLIGGIPAIAGFLGIILLVSLLAQVALKGKESILATHSGVPWKTPWNWEITWQVLIVGFFTIGQIILPLLLGLSGFNPTNLGLRAKAIYVLISYLLMAFAGLLVLFLSIKEFLPLPKSWFRIKPTDNWIFWGIGGYLVAVPLVVIVSLVNQQIWQGQGGSNPILLLALEAKDSVVLAIFFITASVAAPVFEEIMFRGFLLPSLTRYVPVWGAILGSSLIFSIAHLSLSEVLPLTMLGIVLGFVYTRSRNLLAPMLLHSLWNGGTLLSLFVLGSG
ncbi:MAG: CPBP family glutamic-type intramembrane protease [Oscillatoria sp. PMC 1051.18]|nr:CPBP family glutamic-type intramembrane protease [Oscillatoria sp. PMC 1050.18]MEC5029149.1 CPBP family glutamic-type intramembrane protease [Oscillatoria sp. PMC 1051.18]